MTVRAYHWDDPGAPELPSNSNQRFIDNLRIILKACLVDGYGDKPGAGWTLGHDLPDGFSLGNGRGWINVISEGSDTAVAVYIFEEITDFSTPLAAGINMRSGRLSDGYPSTYIIRPRVQGFASTYSNKRWIVVADELTATLVFSGNDTSIDVSSTWGAAFHFGEYITPDESPGFLAMCGNEITSASGNNTPCWRGTGTSVLRNPFTGLVDQGANPAHRAGLATDPSSNVTTVHSSYLLPRIPRIPLCRVNLTSGNLPETSVAGYPSPSGTLRGVLYAPHLTGIYASKVLSGVFGVENPTFEDKFKPLPNILRPDHPGLYMAYPNTGDLGAFISLDPEDWE